MQVLNNDLDDFAVAYIERSTGKKIRTGRDLFAYIRDLDSYSFKKLATACRVAKKRQLDADNGNKAVNVTLTKKAHYVLLRMVGDSSISEYIESLERKAMDRNEWLDMANDSAHAWRQKSESLERENAELKAKIAELEKAANSYTEAKHQETASDILADLRANFERVENEYEPLEWDKPVKKTTIERRCNALKKDGTRCKNTDHLDCENGIILCRYHIGILRNSHANSFKLYNGKTI